MRALSSSRNISKLALLWRVTGIDREDFKIFQKVKSHNWSNAASNESRVALSGSTWPFLCKLGAHDRWGGQPCCGPIKETVPVAPMFSSLTIFYYISLSTSIAQVFLATLEYRLWREWPRSMVWPWFWGPSEFNQNKHGSYMWQSWRACFPIDIDISLYQVYIVVIKYIMITLFTLLLWSWKMIWSLRPCDAVGRISSIIQESSECDIDSDCQNADFNHEHHVYVSSWLFKCAEWKGRKRDNEIQWVKRGMYLVSFPWSLPLFWLRRTALPAHGQPGRGLKTAAFLMFSLLFANIVKYMQSSYHDAAINKLTLLILSCIQRMPWFLSRQDIIQVSTTFKVWVHVCRSTARKLWINENNIRITG